MKFDWLFGLLGLDGIAENYFSSSNTEDFSVDLEDISWNFQNLSTGKVIRGYFSDYSIEKNIGKGSFGSVHLARNLSNNEVVAIKQPNKPEGRVSILTELDILRTMRGWANNEFFVLSEDEYDPRVIEYGSPMPWFASKYYENGDLRQFLDDNDLDKVSFKSIIYTIISGLKEFHDRDLIYYDLKLENIVVSSFDEHEIGVKMIDFGFVTSTNEPRSRGTVYTISPEASMPNNIYPIGTATDMWSLGALMHFIVHGKPLFNKTAQQEYYPQKHYIKERFNEVIETITDCRAEYTSCADIETFFPCYCDLLLRLLRYEPSSRISAADAMRHPFFNYVYTFEGDSFEMQLLVKDLTGLLLASTKHLQDILSVSVFQKEEDSILVQINTLSMEDDLMYFFTVQDGIPSINYVSYPISKIKLINEVLGEFLIQNFPLEEIKQDRLDHAGILDMLVISCQNNISAYIRQKANYALEHNDIEVAAQAYLNAKINLKINIGLTLFNCAMISSLIIFSHPLFIALPAFNIVEAHAPCVLQFIKIKNKLRNYLISVVGIDAFQSLDLLQGYKSDSERKTFLSWLQKSKIQQQLNDSSRCVGKVMKLKQS